MLRRLMIIAFCLLPVLETNSARAEEPEPPGIITGWDRNDGHLLLGELNCMACHFDQAAYDRLAPKQAPILKTAGSRITPQYLRAFLTDPQSVKPGSTMPDLLHDLPQKAETIDKLVHFVASQGEPLDQQESGSSLAQIERGRMLYHTIGCVACHQPFDPPPEQKLDLPQGLSPEDLAELEIPGTSRPRLSIPLGKLAMKTTVEQLAKFLEEPLHIRPSGRMPQIKLEPGEGRLIAAYLLREQFTENQTAPGVGLQFSYYEGNFNKVPDWETLEPKHEGETKSFDIGEITLPDGRKPSTNFAVRFHGLIDIPEQGRYRFWTKSDDGSVLKIDGKLVVDNDGIHAPQEKQGEVNLSPGKHSIEVGLVQGGGGVELFVEWQPPSANERTKIPPGILLHHSAAAMIPLEMVEFTVDPDKAAEGRKLFASLGCANCHTQTIPVEENAFRAPVLAQLKLDAPGSCLSETVPAGRPKFAFLPQQRTALKSVLPEYQQPLVDWSPERELDHTMSAMNCYSCHSRGEKGGPDIDHYNYFAYEVLVDLGDEGRLPPPLHDVGAKLTPEGYQDVFENGVRYRSMMATRMPLFGKDNIAHVPELLTTLDAGKVPEHTVEFTPKMIDDGRLLVGKTALSCINCHAWGEYRLQGAEGLDLLQVPRRIRPEWFHAFLVDPQTHKPRTRMPTAWPNGQSAYPEIQSGDMHRQIDAIWNYLAMGDKGGIPRGLSPLDDTLLVPIDEPIVFRTFLDRVSAHAILVGYPQRVHVAFDANRVRLSVAWTGDFISAKPAWDGRAGQYAPIPSNNVLRFPDGPVFTTLASLNDPWPKDIARGNLGSTARPEGWKFGGYRFDKERIPTFLYSYEQIRVEETPRVAYTANGAILKRILNLSTSQPAENLYLRLAVGTKITEDNGTFLVDEKQRYRIATNGPKPVIRPMNNQQELLIPITFAEQSPPGNVQQANITVELSW